jgi:hypothetical protein
LSVALGDAVAPRLLILAVLALLFVDHHPLAGLDLGIVLLAIVTWLLFFVLSFMLLLLLLEPPCSGDLRPQSAISSSRVISLTSCCTTGDLLVFLSTALVIAIVCNFLVCGDGHCLCA